MHGYYRPRTNNCKEPANLTRGTEENLEILESKATKWMHNPGPRRSVGGQISVNLGARSVETARAANASGARRNEASMEVQQHVCTYAHDTHDAEEYCTHLDPSASLKRTVLSPKQSVFSAITVENCGVSLSNAAWMRINTIIIIKKKTHARGKRQQKHVKHLSVLTPAQSFSCRHLEARPTMLWTVTTASPSRQHLSGLVPASRRADYDCDGAAPCRAMTKKNDLNEPILEQAATKYYAYRG